MGYTADPFGAMRAKQAVFPTESCYLPLMTSAAPQTSDSKESMTLNEAQTNVLTLPLVSFEVTRWQAQRSLQT